MCRPLTHRVAGRPRIRETYWLHMANLELAPALAVWGELPLPILPRLCRTRRLARSLELGRVERDDAQLAADGAAPEGVLPLARVEAQRRLPDPRVGMEVDESEDGIVNVVVILPRSSHEPAKVSPPWSGGCAGSMRWLAPASAGTSLAPLPQRLLPGRPFLGIERGLPLAFRHLSAMQIGNVQRTNRVIELRPCCPNVREQRIPLSPLLYPW